MTTMQEKCEAERNERQAKLNYEKHFSDDHHESKPMKTRVKAIQYAIDCIANHAGYCLTELHGQMLSRDDRLYDMLMEEVKDMLLVCKWEEDLTHDIASTLCWSIVKHTDETETSYDSSWVQNDLLAAMRPCW